LFNQQSIGEDTFAGLQTPVYRGRPYWITTTLLGLGASVYGIRQPMPDSCLGRRYRLAFNSLKSGVQFALECRSSTLSRRPSQLSELPLSAINPSFCLWNVGV
jgi:hypothetical protein